MYTGDYWEQAARRRAPNGDKEALYPQQIRGLAMDYSRYEFSKNPANLTEAEKERYAKYQKENAVTETEKKEEAK